MKKLFLLLFIFTSSCSALTKDSLTKDVWSPYYKEEIYKFVIAQNGQDVIFLGDKFHYVLQDYNGALKRILLSKYHRFLYIDSGDSVVHLYKNNEIVADVTIRVLTTSPLPDAINFFASLGFQQQKNKMLFLKAKINGRRYEATGGLDSYAYSLMRPYEIKVVQEYASSADLGKVALTPLAIIADTIIIFFRILIWPLSSN